MNEKITTTSVSRGVAEVKEEFILENTPRTRIVFRAYVHDDGVKGEIYRYRKSVDGNLEEIIPINFNQLNESEGVKILLSTEALAELYEKTGLLKRLVEEKGVHWGEREYSINEISNLVITDQNKVPIIRKLLENNLSDDIWKELVQTNPDIASKLANSKLHSDRVASLRLFEDMLKNDGHTESNWQDFFDKNKWIFGYGLRYQMLGIKQTQPEYGGTNITKKGGQIGDYLTVTEANVKYTCLVEIKKPSAPLLQKDSYRNGAWAVSDEFAGAISQVHANCATWEIEGSRTDANRDIMSNIFTIAPRGIIVIGNTNQLDNREKKNSFERFRNEIHNPEVITYDELYNRAKFIVGES